MESEKPDKRILQSVDMALQIIDLFERKPEMRLTDISREFGIAKSTAFRLCSTLERRGYLIKRENGSLGLGVRFLTLGSIAKDRLEIIHLLQPLMYRLMERTEETIHLVVWADLYRVLLIDQVLSHSSIQVVPDTRLPRYPHLTSTGMALLAAREDDYIREYLKNVPLVPNTPLAFSQPEQLWDAIQTIRLQGYAINDQRYVLGLVSVSMAIYNGTHQPLAAISVSGSDTRIKSKLALIIQELRNTVEQAAQLPM